MEDINLKEYIKKLYNLNIEYYKSEFELEIIDNCIEKCNKKIREIKVIDYEKQLNEMIKSKEKNIRYDYETPPEEPILNTKGPNVVMRDTVIVLYSLIGIANIIVALASLSVVPGISIICFIAGASMLCYVYYLTEGWYLKEEARYEEKMQEYLIQKKEYNKREKKIKAKLKNKKNTIITKCQKEIDELKNINELKNKKYQDFKKSVQKKKRNLTKKNESLRVELTDEYNKNIIFTKYRDLSAISSFYEYFESGRVDKLNGKDGAYNLYENELIAGVALPFTKINYKKSTIESSKYQYYLRIAVELIGNYAHSRYRYFVQQLEDLENKNDE